MTSQSAARNKLLLYSLALRLSVIEGRLSQHSKLMVRTAKFVRRRAPVAKSTCLRGGDGTNAAKLQLLRFLCLELQCERMTYYRTHKAARYNRFCKEQNCTTMADRVCFRKTEEQSRGRLLFGLEKMCKTLGVSPSSSSAEEIVEVSD